MRRFVLSSALALALLAIPAAASADNPLLGTWHGEYPVNGTLCTFDRVIVPDGTYSEVARCGAMATSQRGTYRLLPHSVVGFNVLDWNPRRRYVVDAQPGTGHYETNAKPPGGMFRYTFLSPSTMVWRDLNFGGRITFHRVR